MEIDPIHVATLVAVIDRIIPADEYPSASEAGGVQFIEGLLEKELRYWRTPFINALDALEAESVRSSGKRFTELSASQQDRLLKEIEAGILALSYRVSRHILAST